MLRLTAGRSAADSECDDLPLRALAHAAVEPPAEDAIQSIRGSTSNESNDSPSDEGTSSDPSEVAGRGARGRGRGRGRVPARCRGGRRRVSEPRRRNRSDEARPSDDYLLDFDPNDQSSDSTASETDKERVQVLDDRLKVGDVVWIKSQGRVVDPMANDGYQRPPRYKLHGFTCKNELEFFESFFPTNLINETAACMTQNGQRIGFGTTWEVTPGLVWSFLGYNMAILTLNPAGAKKYMWLSEVTDDFKDSLWLPPDLGRYGMSWNKFKNLMRAFCLPTYGQANDDPFNPIRRFLDQWNSCVAATLIPGPIICVDESMGLWVGRRNKAGAIGGNGMPGWQFVGRKPTNKGREMFTTACCETGIIIFTELHEGAARMGQKEFVTEWGKNPAKAMRCVKPWFGTGRLVVIDSGFASLSCARGMAENGLFIVGNVKTASAGFPKAWLLSQVHERGQRACATTTIKLSSGVTWSVVAAADRDKQPMTLIATGGTTLMGESMVRHYPVMRADGTTEVRTAIFEQWHVHALYRKNFNALDMHNAKRQGGTSFEDTWKTHRWWLRDFQMLFGMSEVNAYLAWKRFKPGGDDCTPDMFRRRLAYQMLHHPITMLERGERASLRAWRPPVCGHYLVDTPMRTSGQNRRQRRGCRYCCKKTQWTCACMPWVDGMEEGALGRVMFICSPKQSPECFARHVRGEEPINWRSAAVAKGWVTRKANKRPRGVGRPPNS